MKIDFLASPKVSYLRTSNVVMVVMASSARFLHFIAYLHRYSTTCLSCCMQIFHIQKRKDSTRTDRIMCRWLNVLILTLRLFPYIYILPGSVHHATYRLRHIIHHYGWLVVHLRSPFFYLLDIFFFNIRQSHTTTDRQSYCAVSISGPANLLIKWLMNASFDFYSLHNTAPFIILYTTVATLKNWPTLCFVLHSQSHKSKSKMIFASTIFIYYHCGAFTLLFVCVCDSDDGRCCRW